MAEVEEGVFGSRVIRPGEDDERLGWEGWLILLGLGFGMVPAAMLFPAIGLDRPTNDLELSGPAAPPFDLVRLAIGLGLAVVFLVTALLLARQNDQR
jgi:hypothetical protein